MIRILARIWAKWAYVFRKEGEAEMHLLSARVAERSAKLTRDTIAQLTKDADGMEARIKQVAEMEEKGFWLCEDGHENTQERKQEPGEEGGRWICKECFKPLKFVKRSEMSGQEQYESDKDRKEAEKIAAAKRAEITSQEKDLENQEHTAKYFRGQAASSRQLAEALRKV